MDWVELLAAETGLPVGIKSAVGDLGFWVQLASLMSGTGRGIDFVTIDGGEGGTGAAPLIFTDSVSLPFQLAFARVYRVFAEHALHEDVTFIGAGKLGLPDNAVVAFALVCDMVNVAREAMLSIGCFRPADSVEILNGRTAATPLREVYGYAPGWGVPSAADRAEIIRFMTDAAPQGGTAPPSPSAVG